MSFVETSTSDESLYESYRDRGDEAALRALVERHWPGVYRLAHAIVRDDAAAEDAAQEALVRVVQAARGGKRLSPFAGWLRTVTVNEARMWLRSKRRRAAREEAAAARAPQAASPLDPAAAVREYAEALDERLKLPIVLHYGLGLSHAEVGEALGCPAGTASSRIREGLEQVRAALAAKGTPIEAAALGVTLGALAASRVPPVPGVETLVARAAATKAVGLAASKKLGVAVVAFVLCAGSMAALVARNLGDEPDSAPRRVALDPAALKPRTGPTTTSSTGATSAPPSSGTFFERPAPAHGEAPPGVGPLDASSGPRRVVFGGPADAPPPAIDEGPTATHHARVHGRVLDPEGHGVPGARVTVYGTEPGTFRGPSIKLKRRVKPSQLGAAPGKLPDFKQIDGDVQRAVNASHKLRGLKDLAATETAQDGSFELDYERAPLSKVYVGATLERDGATLGAEKPLTGDDAGDVMLRRLPAVVVNVTAGGAPVDGASVSFVDAGGDEVVATTDAKGVARRGTAAPRVLVTVSKPGFATARADAALVEGGPDARLDVVLVPAAQILGTVRGPDGAPLANVALVVEDPTAPDVIGDQPPLAAATTDADGHYTIDGLGAGKGYELEATPADATILRGRLEVTAPATNADLALGRAGSIVCEVKTTAPTDDPRTKDWPGVEVQRQEGAGWIPVFADRSVSGTKITYARLAPGTYRVFAHPMMFPQAESDLVTIPPEGGALTTTIALATGRTITGRVVDGSGRPIARARVTRAENGMMVSMIVKDDSGRFELPGVSNDRYTFTVGATGFEDRSVTAEPGRNDLGDVMLAPAEKGDEPAQDSAPRDR